MIESEKVVLFYLNHLSKVNKNRVLVQVMNVLDHSKLFSNLVAHDLDHEQLNDNLHLQNTFPCLCKAFH